MTKMFLGSRGPFIRLGVIALIVVFVAIPLAPALAEEGVEDAPVSTVDPIPNTDGESEQTVTSPSIGTDSEAPEDGGAGTRDESLPGEDNQQLGAGSAGEEGSEDQATENQSVNSPVPVATTDKKVKPRIDESSGSLVYEYPIVIPPGRNQMQPDLKLSYSSQNNEEGSLFGYGWSLAVPSIERLNKRGVNNLYSRNDFSSSLSGELVDQGSGSFIGRVDSGDFLRYSLQDNVWTVKTKTGMVYAFGSVSASRQDDPNDPSKVYKWFLSEVRDTNNNFIKYEYSKDQGQVYPSRMVYTGSESTDGPFEIVFGRQPRTDSYTSYKSGFGVITSQRISQVEVKINGNWSRRYVFSYGIGSNNFRSLLSTIVESGRADDGTETVLPPVTFQYTQSTPNWIRDTNWTGQGYRWPRIEEANGDAYPDIMENIVVVSPPSTYAKTSMNNTNNTWSPGDDVDPPLVMQKSVTCDTSQRYEDQGVVSADFNGDFLTDFIQRLVTQNNQVLVNAYIRSDVQTWIQTLQWVPNLVLNYECSASAAAAVADFNGDSLPDLYKDQDQAKGLQFNNGNGFDAAVTNWFIPNGEYSTPFGRLVDVNRDSLADGILSEYHVYPRNTYLNKGTGDWAAAANWIVPEPFNTTAFGDTGSRLVDINSDGLTDIIQVRPIDWTVTTWLNTGNGWQQRNDWRPASGQGADWGLTPESKLIDINADGLVDIARGMESEPQGTYYFATGKPADLLEIVTYPTGGTTTATYKSSARYRSSLNELLNPNLPIVVQTVKQLSTVDPVTGISNTETYTYEGGRYYYANAFDRKFAGFAKISLVDGSGNKTVTFYHQGDASNTAQGEFEDHYVKIGKPYRIEIYDSNDNLFKLTINRWDRFDLGGAAGFVKLLQTVDFTYDGNGTHKDKAESYEYNNGTGNITQKISWGEVQGNGDGGFSDLGSDKYVTNILYATGSTLGVSGLPSQETTVDQSGNKIKENRYYYDNMAFGSVDKGNQTKFEQWKDGSNYIHSQKTYNDYGLVTVETDPRDYATTYAYDSLNLYPQTVTNALNQVTQYVYDYSAGKPKQITDPNSLVFQFVYDGLDRQISEKQPDPATPANLVTKTEYFYTDTIGNVNVRKVDWLDSSNEVETYTYLDGLGRILQERRETETFGQFAVKDYGYDNRGLLNKESLPYFNSGATRTSPTTANALYTTYSYDPLARVTSSSNAVGNTINSYNDWRTTVTDANGKTKDLYHDAYDRLIRVDEHNLGNTYTTNYEYNGQDKLTKVTDALGNVRNFSYDGLGRRLSAEDLHVPTDTTFGVWNYQYDNNGNLVLRTDPKTQQVEYGYDRLNRVISEDYLGDGKAGEEIGKDEFVTANVSYGYDTCLNGIGRSCSLSNEALSQTNQYDALGQVTQEAKVINGQTYTSDYSYDFQGNRTLIVNPDGSRFRYTYNSGGQVESIDRKETTDSNYVPVVTDFDYAETGQVSYQAFASGATTTNTYDPSELYRLKRKLTVRNVPTGSTQNVQDLNYTYDAVGNVLQLNDQSELNTRKIITYAYDDLYRLTSARTTHAVAGQNYLQTYQYDAIGNLTYKSDQGTYVYEGNQGNSYANPHAVTKITANGGTITNLTYDQIGNLTSTDSTLTYDWDYNNRLRAVNQNGLLTQTASYGYDPSGIRVKATDFSQTLTIYPSDYYNLQGTTVIKHIMAEQDNIATIHGRGEEAVALANHADHLGGATVMTTLPSSVTTADLAEIIDYYPYGEIRWDSNPGGYLEQRKFIGEIYDQDTGLNYLNARYYNSAIGRFISEDKVFWAVGDSQRIKELTSQELQTILSDPQNLNSYAYARNNPLQYSDPTGLYSWSKFKKDVKNALQSTAKNTKQAWNDYMDWRQKSYERQLSMLEKYPNETNALLFLVGGIRIGKFNKGILETEVGNLEVYRGGNSFKVRAHDIELDANGLIKPGSGVSVNTNPKSVKQFGGAYRVGNLPEGLAVVQQGSDSGHYQITPTKPMTVEQYNKLLGQVELIPISK